MKFSYSLLAVPLASLAMVSGSGHFQQEQYPYQQYPQQQYPQQQHPQQQHPQQQQYPHQHPQQQHPHQHPQLQHPQGQSGPSTARFPLGVLIPRPAPGNASSASSFLGFMNPLQGNSEVNSLLELPIIVSLEPQQYPDQPPQAAPHIAQPPHAPTQHTHFQDVQPQQQCYLLQTRNKLSYGFLSSMTCKLKTLADASLAHTTQACLPLEKDKVEATIKKLSSLLDHGNEEGLIKRIAYSAEGACYAMQAKGLLCGIVNVIQTRALTDYIHSDIQLSSLSEALVDMARFLATIAPSENANRILSALTVAHQRIQDHIRSQRSFRLDSHKQRSRNTRGKPLAMFLKEAAIEPLGVVINRLDEGRMHESVSIHSEEYVQAVEDVAKALKALYGLSNLNMDQVQHVMSALEEHLQTLKDFRVTSQDLGVYPRCPGCHASHEDTGSGTNDDITISIVTKALPLPLSMVSAEGAVPVPINMGLAQAATAARAFPRAATTTSAPPRAGTTASIRPMTATTTLRTATASSVTPRTTAATASPDTTTAAPDSAETTTNASGHATTTLTTTTTTTTTPRTTTTTSVAPNITTTTASPDNTATAPAPSTGSGAPASPPSAPNEDSEKAAQ